MLPKGLQKGPSTPAVPLKEGLQLRHPTRLRIQSGEDPATSPAHLHPGLIHHNLLGHLTGPGGLVAQLLELVPYRGVGALDPVEGQILRDLAQAQAHGVEDCSQSDGPGGGALPLEEMGAPEELAQPPDVD